MKRGKKKSKKSSKKSLIITLGVIILLGAITILFTSNLSNENGKGSIKETKEDAYPSEHLHWDHMPITYGLYDVGGCLGSVVPSKIRESFEIIESETNGIVDFEEIKSGNPDITVNCVDKKAFIEQYRNESICVRETYDYYKNTINVFGEGILDEDYQFPVSITNLELSEKSSIWEICYLDQNILRVNLDYLTTGDARPNYQGKVIINATINIYKRELTSLKDIWTSCSEFPSKEVHEILHTMGFGHSYIEYYSDNPSYDTNIPLFARKDIMSPILYCSLQTEIQPEYSSCLKYIYSNGETGSCYGVNFLDEYWDYDEYGCDQGWYPTIDGEYCCPEPNMEIINGYCY